MLNITEGIIRRPQKVVIYGPEGIGKSSLAAQFPNPLIIDTEGGTSHMDVRRIDKPQSWEELLAIVKEVSETKGICDSLVLDTADWAEQLIITYLCAKYKQNSIETFGYGRGYTYMAEEFMKMLRAFDKVVESGIHVVVTAHAKMRKFEQPDEMGAYDRWEMKLSRQTAPLLKEWCDMLLFCNYRTYVVTGENDTKKGQGGKRVMYTSHHPAWDAKSRIELPDVLPLDYSKIAFAFERPKEEKNTNIRASADAAPNVYETLYQMMGDSGVLESEVQNVVAMRGHYAKDVPVTDYSEQFIKEWLMKHWPKIVTIIETARNAEKV